MDGRQDERPGQIEINHWQKTTLKLGVFLQVIERKGKMRDLFSTTLEEARDKVQWAKDAGDFIHCPCCDQGVKVYPRKITGTMIRQLHQFVFSPTPVEPRKVARIADGRDYAKLQYWGLVKQLESGNWIATESGEAFLYDRLRVPEIAYVYNSELIRFSDNKVGVRERIGTKFDYDELMNGGVWS